MHKLCGGVVNFRECAFRSISSGPIGSNVGSSISCSFNGVPVGRLVISVIQHVVLGGSVILTCKLIRKVGATLILISATTAIGDDIL